MTNNVPESEYLEYICYDESGNVYQIYDDGVEPFWGTDEQNHFFTIQSLGFGWYLLYSPSNVEDLILLSPIKQKKLQ